MNHPEALGSKLWRAEIPDPSVLRTGIRLEEVRLSTAAGMIGRVALKQNPLLAETRLIRMPYGTVFRLSDAETQLLESLWSKTTATSTGQTLSTADAGLRTTHQKPQLWQISRAAVDQALSEFREVGQTQFLTKYGFGKAREYFVRDPVSGNLFDSKAIAGAAYGYQFPEQGPMTSDDFSGGEVNVAARLERVGLEVVRAGKDWTAEEVGATVADYFEMFRLESERRPYAKSDHNRQLRESLRSRSKGAIELKHQNISAILNELGLPFIPGYKPRDNAQEPLRREVQRYID